MRHADREPVLTWPTMITVRWLCRRYCSPAAQLSEYELERHSSKRALRDFGSRNYRQVNEPCRPTRMLLFYPPILASYLKRSN